MTGPRRVIVAHNRYRGALPSGENTVVAAEVERLRSAGVTVDLLIAESDDIGGLGLVDRLALPLAPTWSATTRRRFRSLVAAARPDVVHLHNPYPLLSPMIVRWAKAAGLPVVQTVHNVRHACLAGTWFRDGQECRDCVGRTVALPGVRHGCYATGRGASAALAGSLVAHRGTWRLVDRFLAVSESVTEALSAAGIPDDRVEVRPNGVDDPGAPTPPVGRQVLFAGRLADDKGVPLLLAAWRAAPPPGATLRLAGEGPRRDLVEAAAAADPSITWLGVLDREAMRAEMDAAAVVVVPSASPEACPAVVLEAFAAGRPVVAGAIGGLTELVDDTVGAISELRPDALTSAVTTALGDAVALGAAARRRYEERYTATRSLDRLLAVYDELAA